MRIYWGRWGVAERRSGEKGSKSKEDRWACSKGKRRDLSQVRKFDSSVESGFLRGRALNAKLEMETAPHPRRQEGFKTEI